MNNEVIIKDDTYRLFVPIQDTDLIKAVEVDANGDYIVQGVITSEDTDEEGDNITPEGMDCSYFIDKGWIKYEHGNRPEQFIGEPLAVKIGVFKHPTLHDMVKGIYVKGRLFAQRQLAKEAINTIQELQKSNTKRTMGWSIEGNVKKRDRKTGKIVKSILRNVVLTMNPVNTCTFAELAKSFAKNHELIVSMDNNLDKAMDVSGAAPILPQSVEGAKTEDEQEKWIKLFREFVKRSLLSKSLRTQLRGSNTDAVGSDAYIYSIEQGCTSLEAYEFAEYVTTNHDVIKSIFLEPGGANMSKISEMLDTDLEELRKSIEEDDVELNKSTSKKENKKKDPEDDNEDDEDPEDPEEDDNEDDEDPEDDETSEKSIKTHFAKSLAGTHSAAKQAFEVSEFLANLAEGIGYSMDGFEKSMTHVTKQQAAIVKSLTSVVDVVKSLAEQVEDIQDLSKSVSDLLERPLGRRSVVSTKEVQTLSKSMPGDVTLNRAQIGDVLIKSFEAGEIQGSVITRFEAGTDLGSLNLPDNVKAKLGL